MPILVCSASWTDKTLIACGRFYPPEVRTAEQRLRHYATRFPMAEVDSSFYALPSAANARLWVERTPPAFRFNVKAFRLFTGHATAPADLPGDVREALAGSASLRGKAQLFYGDLPDELLNTLWDRFARGLVPLQTAGKLTAVHFQFAPWIRNERSGRRHVAHCADRIYGHLPGSTLATEFRHQSWFGTPGQRAATLAFERELGAVHVVVDAPQGFANTVPPVWEATHADLAIFRLHGRNARTWNGSGARASSGRFNYDYPDDELRSLVPSIRQLAGKSRLLQVVFNNNHEDQGQRNAMSLARMLAPAG